MSATALYFPVAQLDLIGSCLLLSFRVSRIYVQDGIAILGGVVGAMRIPERIFPGRFDFFFNSHHIMHVLVLIAVIQMHIAAKLDLLWLSNPQCPINSTLVTM